MKEEIKRSRNKKEVRDWGGERERKEGSGFKRRDKEEVENSADAIMDGIQDSFSK